VRELLEALLNLQRIDAELTGLEAAKARLPKRIAELSVEKERLRADAGEIEERLTAVRAELVRRQRDLDGLGAKRSELLSRQLVIKTNEEYAALTHEIGFAKQQISEGEDTVLRLMEEGERLAKEADTARADSASATEEIDRRIEALNRQLAAMSDDVAVKRDERLRMSKRVDAPTLTKYERILGSKGDIAIVGIEDGACSGCRIKLPAQTVIEVKRAQRFIVCESCGRILFWGGERGSG
jgi:predicted  nucleic acid-binding Zn-ribbon protein